jgi:hypothetical protein
MLGNFKRFLGDLNLMNVRAVRDCSCEGVAELVFNIAEAIVAQQTDKRVRVLRVIVHEDSKNSATYET